MSEPFEQPPVPVSEYGKQRRKEFFAWLETNADAMTQAGMQAHEADHYAVNAGQVGLFGHATPQQMGAAVAARPARVGDAWGNGREVERNGGKFDHSIGPAPARRDLRYVDQVQLPGESPLAAFMRNREQQ
jgi:hypothetical protein